MKTNFMNSNAVIADMKLMQKIKRSQRSSIRIIGQIWQIHFLLEWEVVYYELLVISNTIQNLNRSYLSESEHELHQELNGNYTLNDNYKTSSQKLLILCDLLEILLLLLRTFSICVVSLPRPLSLTLLVNGL